MMKHQQLVMKSDAKGLRMPAWPPGGYEGINKLSFKETKDKNNQEHD